MNLRRLFFTVSLAVSSLVAHAEDDAPVGVDCTITDVATSRVTPYEAISRGPWLIHEEQVASNGKTYAVRIEANNLHSWGVLAIKNSRTGQQSLRYGPVGTQEEFSIDFETLKVTCKHYPYNPG